MGLQRARYPQAQSGPAGPGKTIKRRLEEIDGDLATDDGPIFTTVAKLVKALDRAIPHSHDLEAKREALRLGRELLRGTKYEEDQLAFAPACQTRGTGQTSVNAWGGAFMMRLMMLSALFLGGLLVGSCADPVVQRTEIASEAKTSMIDMTKEKVLACMGAPTQQAAAGETEVWSYSSGGDTSSFGSATASTNPYVPFGQTM
jgi:hypothetical protein